MEERHVVTKLKEYGLKYVYEEQVFYQMFKITRKEFLQMLDNAKD